MAFKFTKLKPVEFEDFKATPKVTQELRLRLSQLKTDDEHLEETRDLLAQCFPDKSEEVKKFMADWFSSMDYTRLRVYLLNGDNGLEYLERQMDKLAQEEVRAAMNEAKQND